jgi:uncharacterized small protein (DUF1192 family)
MAKKATTTTLSADEIKAITAQMEKWYESQNKVNSGLDGYIESIKLVGELKKNIATIQKEIDEIEATRLKMTSKKDKDIAQAKINALISQKELIDAQTESIKKSIKEAKKWDMAIGAAGASTIKALANLDKVPNFITGKLGLLRGMFEMDKAIRTTVTQMGTLGKQSDVVRQNIKSAAVNTISFGAGIKEIAEIQAQYTESLGRNVMLSQKSLETVAEMGKSTGLGLEGATEMAVQFDKMGVSAEMAGKFTQEALDRSSSLGLNSTKLMKNINQNFKMLNKYRFKEGIKGLIKMAELSTKLGVDMDFAASMADKLFSVEGAVEMAAQLNVMGGAWAQMADPFKLMYQARNDMQGLTENISKAAASSMSFAQDGSIQTNAMEMQRLRIIAEQTGLEYEKLVELGKTQFKMSQIEMQIGGSDEFKEFIANTAEFKNGKAYIQVESGKKLVGLLSKADRDFINGQIKEKESMKKRAEAALSFDEKITNLINMVKTTMMPIVEGLTKGLEPLVKTLTSDGIKKDLISLGENIGKFVEWAAKGVGSFVKTIVDIFGPTGLFIGYLAGKAAIWIANGLSLAAGFRMGTGGMFGGKGGGGMSGMLGKGGKTGLLRGGSMVSKGNVGGGMVTAGKAGFSSAGKLGGGLGVLGGLMAGGSEYLEQKDKGKSTTESAGRGVLKGGATAGGAFLGAKGGAAAGAAIGALFGGVGAIPGALIGGLIGSIGGGMLGSEVGDLDNYGVKDGLFEGSNKNRRAVLQNGKITPIDKKDDLLALKKYGIASNAMRSNANSDMRTSNKIEFGELKITGEIKVSLPDGSNIGQELIKSQEFKTSITRVVQAQLEKNNNGGKNKG